MSIWGRAVGVGPPEQVVTARHLLGQGRHPVLRQHLFDPVAVLLADHRLELTFERVGVDTLRQLDLGRHDEVDAVGLAVDVLVDPLQLDFELLGREVQRPEDAHAPGPAHRGDDVATMTEREDREFQAQVAGELSAHFPHRNEPDTPHLQRVLGSRYGPARGPEEWQ